ncbi:myb-like protein Q [Drosophila busckii]|uniref:myb-like protein Q n=1 Tax=Drosophila busckii TaxID=30019 RepID=UPI00083F2957|nr:myb-like protein Q [Drosophila busckii]
MMVRPNRRKGIEEVYGSKLEPMQTGRQQPLPNPTMNKTATMRVNSSRQSDSRTQRSYMTANDYYITTNLPLDATNMRTAPSNLITHGSKTNHIPVQMQHTNAQPTPYGNMSGRRQKASARQQQLMPQQQAQQQQQQQLPKAHFNSIDAKQLSSKSHVHGHAHGHSSHTHVHSKPIQRGVYAINPELEVAANDFSEKDQMMASTSRHSYQPHPHPHAHPPQHQLHQQQQLMLPNSSNSNNNNNNSSSGNNNNKHHHHHTQKHQRQAHSHPHPQPHTRGMQLPTVTEEDDNDDPEEFFDLIRQTVQSAIGTTITDLMNRNFRELGSKMERFSNDLKITNEQMDKLQAEVCNKVMQYGEENSRHFRYLCMKSEYDKMFYQHQTMITNAAPSTDMASTPIANTSQCYLNMAPSTSRAPKQAATAGKIKSVKQQLAGRKADRNVKNMSSDCIKVQNPCVCRSTSKSPKQQTLDAQQSTSEQSVNAKSSDIGVHEVLGQIQRYCTQMQLNEIKDEQQQPKYGSQMHMGDKLSNRSTATLPGESATAVAKGQLQVHASKQTASVTTAAMRTPAETPIDSMDEMEIDNFEYSSDEMSSFSDDSDMKFHGNTTARPPLQSNRGQPTIIIGNNGAGDA